MRRLVVEELARALARQPSAAGRPAPAPSAAQGLQPAIVVFSGATVPDAPLLALLEALRRQGWALAALPSLTFSSVVLGPRPASLGSLARIEDPDDEADFVRRAAQARLWIFPDLSDNALAKATRSIADSIPTRAMAAALASGAPCLLLETARLDSPIVGLPRLEGLRRLERRGAVISTLSDFADRLLSATASAPVIPAPFAPLSRGPSPGGQPAARPVVTADDVLAAARRGLSSLRLPPRAIVTDRAREEALRRRVELIADEAVS